MNSEKMKEKLQEIFKKEEIMFSSIDDDFLVSDKDYYWIEKFPLKEVIPIIKELSKDKDWRVRLSVIGALCFLEVISEKEVGVIEILKNMVKNDDNKGIRAWAAWELKGLGEIIFKELISEEKVKELLEEALKEDLNPTLKFAVAIAMAREEDRKGEGIKELQRMKERGELTKRQIEGFERLCRELKIEETIERAEEGVKEVRKSIEQEEQKEESLAKVALLEQELEVLKQSVQETKEERIRDRKELEKRIGLTIQDIGTIQEDIETIPHMQVAFKGEALETRITHLETDMRAVKKELEGKKMLINRWIGIGLGISIVWAIVTTILALIFAYLDIIK